MKNTLQAYSKRSEESGIAIMFTLIMLSVFFIIAFGFVSMATSAKAAANAREPQQEAALTAEETVLNEALFSLNKIVFSDGGNSTEIPDYSKFTDLTFRNGGGTEVTFKAWGTANGTPDITNLATNTKLQVYDADDFEPDYTGTNFSINSDDYFWMVLESSGVDPNYIGGVAGDVNGVRHGIYARELDPTIIHADFDAAYIDWTTTAPRPIPWTDKKTLINALGASALETAVALFEPGTTPVQLKGFSGSTGFDLSTNPSGTVDTFKSSIPWLNNSTDSDEALKVAANLKDFIDSDNYISSYSDSGGTKYGIERVPVIQELGFSIENISDAGAADDAKPITVELTVKPEFLNIWYGLAPPNWDAGVTGAATGSSARVVVKGNIRATRGTGGQAITMDETFTVNIDSNLSAATARTQIWYNDGDGDTTVPSTATTEESTGDIDSITVEITEIELYGNSSDAGDQDKLWDKRTFSTPLNVLTKGLFENGDEVFVNVYNNSCDPRDRDTDSWSDSGEQTDEADAQASNWGSPPGTLTPTDNETSVSTYYMPPGGEIEHLSELGCVHRGGSKTLNLVDYNIDKSDRFVFARWDNSGDLDLTDAANSSTSFDGGDRSLLDYVYISSPGAKVTTAGTVQSYKQFGAINPNTSQRAVLEILLKNTYAPYISSSGLGNSEISALIDNFPGIVASTDQDNYFYVSDFHDTEGDNYHNRNPKTFGYPFSLNHPTEVVGISDVDREALVIHSMNLVSPKYSYFTIIGAADVSSSPAKIKAFVRRDGTSGSFKVIRMTVTN